MRRDRQTRQTPAAGAPATGRRDSLPPDLTVFIVDDDESTRQSLTWLVRSVGLTARCFQTGEDFLQHYDVTVPGCLVLDVRMPGMSGLEVLDRIAAGGPAIPAVVITAYGDVPTAVRAMKTGAVDFLEKPFHDQQLLDCVRTALERDARRRQRTARRSDARQRLAALTPRERDVLNLLATGISNRDVAARLGLSPKTVELHRYRIVRKTDAVGIADLIRLVLDAGLEETAHGDREIPSPARAGGKHGIIPLSAAHHFPGRRPELTGEGRS